MKLDAPTGPLIVPALGAGAESVWFSLVVPTYNERGNVEALVKTACALLDQNYKGRYEIIFADDNSPDGTADRVMELASDFSQVRVMVRTEERGLATAVIRGWQKSRGEVLGVIDGDLQHPMDILLPLLKHIEGGADLAFATRYTQEGGLGTWGLMRKLNSQVASMMCYVLLPEVTSHVSDPMSGCFVLRRSAIEGVILQAKGYKILLEILGRGRAKKIAEAAYVFQMRQHGTTKLTWKQYLEYIQQLCELRMHLWTKRT